MRMTGSTRNGDDKLQFDPKLSISYRDCPVKAIGKEKADCLQFVV